MIEISRISVDKSKNIECCAFDILVNECLVKNRQFFRRVYLKTKQKEHVILIVATNGLWKSVWQ